MFFFKELRVFVEYFLSVKVAEWAAQMPCYSGSRAQHGTIITTIHSDNKIESGKDESQLKSARGSLWDLINREATCHYKLMHLPTPIQ